jgi:phosphate-selective porin OprO and OprP
MPALSLLAAAAATALSTITPASATAADADAADRWRIHWRNGTHLESPDGDVVLTLGGRLQVDVAPFVDGEGALSEVETGSELRRARLHAQGRHFDRFLWKVELDFSSPDAPIRDVYVGLQGLGPGTLVIGHFKEPFALDDQTSNRYLTFPERPTPVLALGFERNFGAMLFGRAAADRVTWKVGAFQDMQEDGEIVDGSEVHFTGRVTGVPLRRQEGARLLHLGAALSLRDPPNGQLRYRAKPENHLLEDVLATPSFPAQDARVLGLEAALVHGPFHLQAEAFDVEVSSRERGDPSFGGLYVQAGYFLTGEHRPYTTSGLSGGAFDRVRPKRPIERDWASGAWEVALRYSKVDLESPLVGGGIAETWSATVNWYLNSWARTLLTFVDAEGDPATGAEVSERGVVVRFQVDF